MVLRKVEAGSVPDDVIALCRHLRDRGYQAWVVGGSLRDILLGRAPKDWDIATSATPQQMLTLWKRVVPTGIAHGTVTVLVNDRPYEVTTLRGEGAYSDSRRPDQVFFVDDIEHDLARRDFTVNAVAYDPLRDQLVDPFGGIDDMERRLLRTVGKADERFAEDGLRILRAARFVATLEFTLEARTRDAIPAALPSFAKVSAERVRDEWLRTMEAREPSRGFEVMRATGILALTCPELLEQVGCAQNRFHAYDVWQHSLSCMDACDRGPVHRVAGLLHDLGKPRTRVLSDKTQDYTFYHHEVIGAELADAWLRAYRFSNDDRAQVVHLVRHHLVCYSSDWTDAAVRRFARRVGPDHVAALLSLARADALAKGRPAEAELGALDELQRRLAEVAAQGAALGTRDLAITGHDIMARLGVPPGPIVGRLLEKLLEQVLDDPSRNERDTLLQLVDAHAEELAS